MYEFLQWYLTSCDKNKEHRCCIKCSLLSKQQTHCLSPVCFFFCRTGDPQQRVPYAPRPPSARRLGTVPSGLKGAASLCCSQEVDWAPSAKTRSMRETKLNCVTTNSTRTQDNNISSLNFPLTFTCLLVILWWKLFTLISVVSDAVSSHCALNSTTHQTALPPRRSPSSHALHSSWCCWRGVLWHSTRAPLAPWVACLDGLFGCWWLVC